MRPSADSYKSLVLNPDECSPPQLSQAALSRICTARENAKQLLDRGVAAYREELKADPNLTKGLPPKTRINQLLNAFAKALSESQATEYFGATGKEGAARWREMVCKAVFSEVAQVPVYLGTCFALYKGPEDLQAVIEAAVDGVIEGMAGGHV